MWLDAIEVKVITDSLLTVTPSINSELQNVLSYTATSANRSLATVARDIVCPRDSTALREQVYASDSGVLIHHCPTCTGIWLDGGELYRVSQYLEPKARDYLAELILNEQKNTAEAIQGIKSAMFFPVRMATYFASPLAILGEIVYFIYVHTDSKELHKKYYGR